MKKYLILSLLLFKKDYNQTHSKVLFKIILKKKNYSHTLAKFIRVKLK